MAKAKLIYTDLKTNKRKTKEITIPEKRFGYGILKQRKGFVVVGGFTENPKKLGSLKTPFKKKIIKLSKSAGTVTLKIGKRFVSKAN